MRAWGMLLLVGCTIDVVGPAPAVPQGPPPPPRQEVVTPRVGFVWVHGRWVWQGQWVWMGGHWERERAGMVAQQPPPLEVAQPPPPPLEVAQPPPPPLEIVQPPPPPPAGPGNGVIAWSDSSPGNEEIYVKQWDGQAWRELGPSAHGGGISNTPTTRVAGVGDSATPVIAVDARGYPIVAWTERVEVNHYPQSGGESTISRDEVYVRRWNGSAWIELAGSGHGAGISDSRASGSDTATYPSIAVDRVGRIVVAWQEADLRHGGKLWISARRWNGHVWEDLGGSSGRFGISGEGGAHPSLAIDPEDRPVIAWTGDSDHLCIVAVKRWTGSAWEPLADSAGANGISGRGGTSDPSLALDHRGNAIVIWALSGTTGFGARQWDGQAWRALTHDPKSQSCTAGNEFSVTIDAQGAPIVGQYQLGKRAPLEIARWTGSTWAVLPSPGNGDGTVALATEAGGVLATWQDQGIRAARWDGRAWRDLGLLTTSTRAWWPRVAAR